MKETKRYGGILVKFKDEVLLCKRNKFGSNLGSWSIPAGKLNKNELPFLGAKREFFEETNIVSLEKIKHLTYRLRNIIQMMLLLNL